MRTQEIIGRSPYGYDITQQLRTLGFADVVEGTVYIPYWYGRRGGLVVSENILPN